MQTLLRPSGQFSIPSGVGHAPVEWSFGLVICFHIRMAESDPHRLLRLLASPERLRAFSAVVLGGGSGGEVAARADMSTGQALRALAQLADGDLVEHQAGHGWAMRPGVLRDAASTPARPWQPAENHSAAVEDSAVLNRFLQDGRIVTMPAQRTKRRVVLEHVADAFDPQTHYSEREVNALLQTFYDDCAALRRYLVDEGFLERNAQVYWRQDS